MKTYIDNIGVFAFVIVTALVVGSLAIQAINHLQPFLTLGK